MLVVIRGESKFIAPPCPFTIMLSLPALTELFLSVVTPVPIKVVMPPLLVSVLLYRVRDPGVAFAALILNALPLVLMTAVKPDDEPSVVGPLAVKLTVPLPPADILLSTPDPA